MTPEDRAIAIYQAVFKRTGGKILDHYEDGDAFWLPIAEQIREALEAQAVKLKGIPIKGVTLGKNGKIKPKQSYRSVSAKIAAGKNPKQKFKRGK